METLTLIHTEEIVKIRVKAVLPTAARRAVATLFLVNGMLFATWVSRIPAIETARGMSHTQLGLALFVIALGAMVAMPLSGALSSRFGRDRVCRIAVLVYAGMLPLLVLALTRPSSLSRYSVSASATAHSTYALNSQAVSIEKTYRRPIMFSFHALFSTGGLLGAALGGGIAAFGLSPSFHFTLIAILLAALAMTTFRHLHSTILKYPTFITIKPLCFPAEPCPSRLGRHRPLRHDGRGRPGRLERGLSPQVIATSEGLAAAGYAAFSIAMATGRFFGDKLASRFGPVQLVRGSALVAVAGLVLLLATPWPGAALIGFACVGFGFAPIVPMVFSAAGHRSGISPGRGARLGDDARLSRLPARPARHIGFAADLIGLHVALGLLLVSTLLAVALAPAVRSAQPD